MVQQDLETLHRITWPGVVASDNDIGRRGSSSLEPAANLGRKLLLDDLGPAANQPENLPRTSSQMADREARPNAFGSLVNRLPHRVA